MAAGASTKTIHQLKITIAGVKPPVWRRVLVPSGITLAQLHGVIQEVFAWCDCHLHEFEIDGVSYGLDDGEGWGEPPVDEREVKLATVVAKATTFVYLYDFGDSWEHRVEVEDIAAAEPAGVYPCCLAGKRAGPPEDVGGSCGYAEFLNAITDPDHEEHDSMLEWSDGGFDPERCDLVAINAGLSRMRDNRVTDDGPRCHQASDGTSTRH